MHHEIYYLNNPFWWLLDYVDSLGDGLSEEAHFVPIS
jgi:hypothetical protein